MASKVVGSLNLGYVLILATYAMAWIVSVLYVRIAGRSFDRAAEARFDEVSFRAQTGVGAEA